MNNKIISLIFIICFSFFSYADDRSKYLDSKWKLSFTQKNYLANSRILADADVDTDDNNQQTFRLKAMAMHKKTCRKVLRKLSMLENYADWIDFVKRSSYHEKSKLFTLKADHPVLPNPMIVHIIVDRPTKMGRYNFTFPTGMFTGLTGHFEITEFNKNCHFDAESYWKGKKGSIPDLIIEIFAETLSKIGGETLMRKI